MKRSFVVSGIILCLILSIAAFLQASGIVPAIVPSLSPSTSRRGTTTPASGAGIFQLAANTTAGAAGAAICDDGTGNTTTSGCTANAVTSTTPVTVNTNTTMDQQLMELSLSAAYLNSLGRPFDFFGAGVYTTQAGQTPTLTFKIKLCTVSGCGSGTVVTLVTVTSAATTASSTNFPWSLRAVGTTAATGATGNLEIHGPVNTTLGASATGATTVYNDSNTAVSGNIDLTAALFVDFTVTFSTNAATANTCTQREGVVSPGGSTAGAGGGGGAFTQISKCGTPLGGSAATITCSSIPGTSNNLQLWIQARGDGSGNTQGVNLQFNADSGANYEYIAPGSLGSGTTSAAQTSISACVLTTVAMTANFAAACILGVPNYAGTTFNKQLLDLTGSRLNPTGPVDYEAGTFGNWNSTAAITSITLTPSAGNFIAGSTVILYGLN